MKNKIRAGFILIIGLLLVSSVTAAPKEMENITISKGKVFLNLKDADVKSVLQIFAKATKVNIVAADDVTGKVTVTFSGIEPKEGLEAVLRTKGLDWFEESGTIFVSTKKIMRTYYLGNAKPSDLSATLTAILPAGSTVTADDSYNALVIQTSSDYLPRIERLIKELDIPPIQVMVEAQIIEIRVNSGGSLGLDVKYTKANNANDVVQTKNLAGRPTDNPAQGLYGQVFKAYTDVNVEGYLSALATGTNYNVVASPKITTMNNKEATILIGAKYGYKTSVISDTTTTQVVNFLSVGTSLVMTPNVSKNGLIRMKVAPKVSEGSVVGDLPQENTTETKNEVVVRDGQTFVIGGLIKEKDVQTDFGIPYLMDIPLLGSLFRKTVTSKEKSELLVFVTPHIVTPEFIESMNKPKEELEKKSAGQKARLIH
ncbi:MAG: secretin N-terminal domain-containing protein [Candidatus Margulisiibacteriota bacterium]|jgi:type IV pilus assembly protein PilQ